MFVSLPSVGVLQTMESIYVPVPLVPKWPCTTVVVGLPAQTYLTPPQLKYASRFNAKCTYIERVRKREDNGQKISSLVIKYLATTNQPGL
jgi:hypothetical protein